MHTYVAAYFGINLCSSSAQIIREQNKTKTYITAISLLISATFSRAPSMSMTGYNVEYNDVKSLRAQSRGIYLKSEELIMNTKRDIIFRGIISRCRARNSPRRR